MIEKALYTRLSGYAGLSALVSTRIYPFIAQQKSARPYLTYQRVSTVRPSAMAVDIGIAQARFQIDAWGDTYDSVKSVSEQVRAALQRFSGTVSAVDILDIYIDNEQDLFEDDAKIYRVSQDYTIFHRE